MHTHYQSKKFPVSDILENLRTERNEGQGRGTKDKGEERRARERNEGQGRGTKDKGEERRGTKDKGEEQRGTGENRRGKGFERFNGFKGGW